MYSSAYELSTSTKQSPIKILQDKNASNRKTVAA